MNITRLYFILSSIFLVYVIANPVPVSKLDIQSYLGRWYQVMGGNFNVLFSGNGTCATADYFPLANKSRIGVFNNQILDGKYNNISGYAEEGNPTFEGILNVYLDGVPNAGEYYIYYLGPIVNSSYISAIVSDQFFLSLYVLVRNVDYYYQYLQTELTNLVKEWGFINFWNHYYNVSHKNCSYPLPPIGYSYHLYH